VAAYQSLQRAIEIARTAYRAAYTVSDSDILLLGLSYWKSCFGSSLGAPAAEISQKRCSTVEIKRILRAQSCGSDLACKMPTVHVYISQVAAC